MKIKANIYKKFLQEIIDLVIQTRIKATQNLNKERTELYYNIGKSIVLKQEKEGWGKSIVEKLSVDMQQELGSTTGFSPENLWKMRQFYLTYQENNELLQLACKIPWGHNIVILTKIKNLNEIKYYIESIASFGWTRDVLINQIKAQAFERHKLLPKQHNFNMSLTPYLAEQAEESLKSEYNLDFLGITRPIHEKQLENRLIEKLKQFLMELGYGFCYIGNQYRIALEDKEYFVDLLFYHRKLRCLIAIDLKIGDFEPEYAGKMNLYLNLLDDKAKMEEENPSIGIILCAGKKNIEVEYTLRTIYKPIAVAKYELGKPKKLPLKLRKELPSPDELSNMIKSEIENE